MCYLTAGSRIDSVENKKKWESVSTQPYAIISEWDPVVFTYNNASKNNYQAFPGEMTALNMNLWTNLRKTSWCRQDDLPRDWRGPSVPAKLSEEAAGQESTERPVKDCSANSHSSLFYPYTNKVKTFPIHSSALTTPSHLSGGGTAFIFLHCYWGVMKTGSVWSSMGL